MPNNAHNKNHSKGRRRNPRHKKDFQDRDRAPTFTDEAVSYTHLTLPTILLV